MYKVDIKQLDNSEVEITGELTTETFETHRQESIKKISEKFDIPGFRKGHVPENIIIQKVGETPILEEMAERALAIAYPAIIAENKIEAIGRPEVSITKIASGNPLGFKIKTAVMPEIKLPDYKKIGKDVFSKKEVEVEVTDKEVDDVILEIRKQRAKNTPDESKSEENNDKKEAELPELTDEFVKTLGEFKNIEDLKVKLKENIKKEKEMKELSKKRVAVMDKIIEGATITLPNVVVESELDKMMSQFEGDVSRMGLKIDEYLKHVKKTREELRKEWRPDAEKRAKTQLALNKIAIQEKVTVPKEEIEHEVKHIMEHHKDAHPHNVSIYVETTLTNEKVFKLLEEQK